MNKLEKVFISLRDRLLLKLHLVYSSFSQQNTHKENKKLEAKPKNGLTGYEGKGIISCSPSSFIVKYIYIYTNIVLVLKSTKFLCN